MPQQKDIFDQAIEEMQAAPAAANAPTPAPQWQQTFEKLFPAQAQAAHQMGQAGQGLMQLAGSVSPLRFREGWDAPTLEVPEAVNAFIHPLNTIANMWDSLKSTVGTVGREAGAMAAPNSVQAPSQPEMDQATRSATGLAASAVMPAIPEAATALGIPQAMSRAASLADATPSWMIRHPVATAAKAVTGPLLRAGARALFEPEAASAVAPNPVIDAQFEGPEPEPYQNVNSKPVREPGKPPRKAIAAGSQRALPPEPPPGQIAGAPPQAQVGTSMTHQAALPAAPAESLPAGSEGVPVEADPRLPESYANQPVARPTAGPGMMVRGQIRMGDESAIASPKIQDAIGTRTPHIAIKDEVTAKFRRMTDAERQAYTDRLIQDQANAGRGVTKEPNLDAAPLKLPSGAPKLGKPTPPRKAAK